MNQYKTDWKHPVYNAALREEVAKGGTALQVAERLQERLGVKVTRNAVIGATNRLGILLMGSPKLVWVRPPDVELVGASDTGLAVLNLTPWCCRWPIGDPLKDGFRFCCEAVADGNSYCPEHMGRARSKAYLSRRDIALIEKEKRPDQKPGRGVH